MISAPMTALFAGGFHRVKIEPDMLRGYKEIMEHALVEVLPNLSSKQADESAGCCQSLALDPMPEIQGPELLLHPG